MVNEPSVFESLKFYCTCSLENVYDGRQTNAFLINLLFTTSKYIENSLISNTLKKVVFKFVNKFQFEKTKE